ncbi:TTL-domain-containing protein [Lepidopterella palustris CBS 459.81]|uniref:TTL-domain-containing protein n=1 Tax=Lepidopterella palustris CBS 459.81 TaxID=1314670 RepID=A0A8E2JDJ1_9PEZI|nr:TTL-domain-containing protein [Lepidopterella palustris CBS 459.81]
MASPNTNPTHAPASAPAPPKFSAIINYEDPYVQPLILSALASALPPSSYTLITTPSQLPTPSVPLLQFLPYELLDFDHMLNHPTISLGNAYIIRKALIRKHYLSTTIANWVTKHPESVLKRHVKPAVDFELDYAEFLDEALVEAFELREGFQRNEGKEPQEREWWILKPSMSDRGQGIRLFSTEEELAAIFEEWEAEAPDSEDEDGDGVVGSGSEDVLQNDSTAASAMGKEKDYIITSHLRHFVAQPYIHPPLLLSPSPSSPAAPRKFHIRTYVLAVGALRVYVYKPMLALFAARAYTPPWECGNAPDDLRAHLTNTCLQDTGEREGSVSLFWSLPDSTPSLDTTSTPLSSPGAPKTDGAERAWKEIVWAQICAITAEIFEAAARDMMVHFQPLPNAFELFGLDFLVQRDPTNESLDAYLLEVNAFPDFKQTGVELQDLVGRLFKEVVEVSVKPFFLGVGGDSKEKVEVAGTENLKCVLDIDLGRR